MSVVNEFRLDLEYAKDTGIKPQDVAAIREWLIRQPHLPAGVISDLDIILAYHCCNQSTEAAKQVLDLNVTLKTRFTRLFKDREFDEKVERALKTMLITPLPTRSKDGCATIFVYFLDKSPKNFILVDALRVALMLIELWQYEQGTWPGFMVIADLAGIGIAHTSCFDYTALKHFFYFVQHAILVRMKGIHIVNAPPVMNKMMALLNTVSRVDSFFHIHSKGYQDLEKYYPIEGLPQDVGGNYKKFEACRDDTIEKLKANGNFFALDNKKRVCEALRPVQPSTVSNFFSSVVRAFRIQAVD